MRKPFQRIFDVFFHTKPSRSFVGSDRRLDGLGKGRRRLSLSRVLFFSQPMDGGPSDPRVYVTDRVGCGKPACGVTLSQRVVVSSSGRRWRGLGCDRGRHWRGA